jgi:protein TonB
MNLQDFCYQPHVGFEGRNQAYGAYELRKKYSKTLSTTLLVVVFSSATLFATPIIQRVFSPKEEIVKQIDNIEPKTIPIDILPKEPEIEKPEKLTRVVTEPIKQPPVSEIDFREVQIVDKPVDSLITNKQAETTNSAISDKNQIGDGSPIKPEETITDVKGELTKGLGDKEEEDNTVKEGFMIAQDASFEGGIDEFRKQLQKYIVYPSLAHKKGTQGTVHLQFVVEKDGSISNISVLKGIGDGCDEEAIRALKKITTLWASGKDAKGKSVRVRKSIPIKFTINQ